MEKTDISIVLPCMNEEQTLGQCIQQANKFIKDNSLRGEVIVVDNLSTDDSAGIAEENGARVVVEVMGGYGYALRAGIRESKGSVIIMADCDTTYDLYNINSLFKPLFEGKYDIIMGNRFAGGIEKGAMPLSHYFGVKALSWLGRRRFSTDVYDFHCGLRGMTRAAADILRFETGGMEFATEMIALASKAGLKIGQVPVTLSRGPKGRSKLHTLSDGMRHLKYIIRG